jgi:protein SDA1
MIAAISFLLGYESAEHEDDSDASSSEDEDIQNPHVILSREDVYKVTERFIVFVLKICNILQCSCPG